MFSAAIGKLVLPLKNLPCIDKGYAKDESAAAQVSRITHVYFDGTAADGTDLILPLFLANGITGVRDMGSDLDPVLHARDEIAAHRLFGQRMIVSGPMLAGI
jgi:hypothetical protein